MASILLHGEHVSTDAALKYADALVAVSFRTQNRAYSRTLIRQAYDVRRQVSEALGCSPLRTVNPIQGETL